MIAPWYKQFWPWFLIALPGAAVIASFATLYLAISSPNDMVVESYYKKGKGINSDLSLMENARQLGINAKVRAERDHLVLNITLPEAQRAQPLSIQLAHRTQAGKDYQAMVTADANGEYRFAHDLSDQGRWYLQIMPVDKSWRLEESLVLPLGIEEVIDGK
ncbi:FixH family protein [Aliagarivorans marinus]|uniref:FixH family protein n=1 Tax=Aliagarivorans marinus TaxID=561965 RepID=UPI0003FFD0D4|nr:FixH family protein [Aliagarivorans marinus]